MNIWHLLPFLHFNDPIEEVEGKKKEELLPKTQEEATNLFQNSPLAGIYHDEKGIILNINKKFTALFGYTLAELKGKNVNEGMIFPEEETIRESKEMTQMALAGEEVKYKTIRKKKDGTLLPVIITVAAVIKEGESKTIVAFYQDISEEQEMLARLTESERKYRNLFNNMPATYYQVDRDGNIITMNPYGVKLLGYRSEEEIIGKNMAWDLYYNPEDRAKFLADLKNKGGIIKDYEVILKNKEGVPIIISTNSQYYYHESGELLGVEGIFVDITERKKQEAALRKSQQEFASLFQSSPVALVYVDEKSIILDINPRFTELFGYAKEEVKGKNINNGIIYPAEKREEAEYLYQKSLLSNYYNYETIRKRKDGSTFWVSISNSTVLIDGQPQGRIISYTDITESKRNELIQQVLYNISKATNSTISLNTLYRIIHQELSKLIDTTNFYIALLDKEKGEIYFPYNVDEFQRTHHSRPLDHHSLIAYLFKTGKPILVNQKIIQENPEFRKYKEWFGSQRQSWLGVSLKIEGETIGALVVQSYKKSAQYTEEDIKIMEIVSSQVSIAIKRKQDEEALKKSQQEFASLFQSHSEALLYVDEKGTILDINKRFSELFGYTLEEIKGKNINCGIIHPPEKIEEGKELDQKTLSSGYVQLETIRKKKDGTIFPVFMTGSTVFIDGKACGIICTYIDISERKKFEEQLQKMACTDALTCCYNRRYGLELLEQQIKLMQRLKSPILIAFLDIDNFKAINDNFGHQEGDKILTEVGNLLKSTLREVDIICRIGGDEFLLTFPNTSIQEAPLIRSRLEEKLVPLNRKISKNYQIQFSMGFVEYLPGAAKPLDKLITIADQRMYEDKKKKKKTINQ